VPEVISRDHTRIVFDRQGKGAPLILVDGALCYRKMGPSASLAEQLAPHFTVFSYDRRGRGESGDTRPYAVEREIEDLQALIAETGGEANVFGVSSGAALALDTASQASGVRRLALYEAPFIVDRTRDSTSDYWARIGAAVAAGRSSEAVKLFMKSVGMPSFMITIMRLTPVWKTLAAVGHTLPYDGAIVKENQQGKPLSGRRWASATMPTLVMDGSKSPPWMRNATRALADVLPNAQYRTLDGQTHMVKAAVHAPVLVDFFKA